MANGHGGYRQPANPAPVSGPGSLSERTDGGAIDGMQQPMQTYTGFEYGENKSLNEQQAGAPMAATAVPDMLTLDAPTALPDQPISHGADWGEGPGVDLSGIRTLSSQPDPSSVIYNMMRNDPSGQLESLYNRINLA